METNVSSLEKILTNTISAIEKSKEQIFEISESARLELIKISEQLEEVVKEINIIIDKVDSLEIEYKKSRGRLAYVSKNFKLYSEKDIQKAYEETNKFQMDLMIIKEREANLQATRNGLQLRIKNIEFTLEKANILSTQVSVVYDYLKNDINMISEIKESSQLHQMIGIRIIQAQEEEKKRIAREIHDGPAQSMANVVLRADIIEKLIDLQNIDSAKEELNDLKLIVRQNLAAVRRIIYDLRPMALDDLGLFPTLRKYIPEIAKRGNLDIQLNILGKEKRLLPPLEVALFRLIQELINNVIKHAEATNIIVNIKINDEYIKIVVEDNGKGFIEEEVTNNSNHFGLIGLKERVKLFEGKYEINSEVNKGTVVAFEIPMIKGEIKIDE